MSEIIKKAEAGAVVEIAAHPDPVIGVVVASTSREGPEHGRPVLLALWKTLSLLQGQEVPYLFLAGTTSCLQYHYDSTRRTLCPHVREPSAVAAQRLCLGTLDTAKTGRWLLVHLDKRDSLHLGLLPWLTLLGDRGGNITTVLLHDLHAIMSNPNRVIVAAPFVKERVLEDMLQLTWSSLMSKLDHREQK